MPYYYTDASRESNLHALPDVEVFYSDDYGRLIAEGKPVEGWFDGVGYYYAFGFPGCLWDSDPVGPYDTYEEALAAARESAGYCQHGIADDGDEVCEECPAPELWAVRNQWRDGLGWFVSQDGRNAGSPLTSRTMTPDFKKAACWCSEEAASRNCGEHETVYRLTDSEARNCGRN